MGDLSLIQIVMVLVIALLVFGPGRMPEIGRQVGKGLRELRRHASSVTTDLTRAMDDDEPSRAQGVPSRRPTPTPAPPAEPITERDLMVGVVLDGSSPALPERAVEPPPRLDDEMLEGVVVPGSQPPLGQD